MFNRYLCNVLFVAPLMWTLHSDFLCGLLIRFRCSLPLLNGDVIWIFFVCCVVWSVISAWINYGNFSVVESDLKRLRLSLFSQYRYLFSVIRWTGLCYCFIDLCYLTLRLLGCGIIIIVLL